MKAMIDGFGRVVVPKKIRDKFGFKAGDELESEEFDYKIELKASNSGTPLKVKDGTLVYSGRAAGNLVDAVRESRTGWVAHVGGMKKR